MMKDSASRRRCCCCCDFAACVRGGCATSGAGGYRRSPMVACEVGGRSHHLTKRIFMYMCVCVCVYLYIYMLRYDMMKCSTADISQRGIVTCLLAHAKETQCQIRELLCWYVWFDLKLSHLVFPPSPLKKMDSIKTNAHRPRPTEDNARKRRRRRRREKKKVHRYSTCVCVCMCVCQFIPSLFMTSFPMWMNK